jgi:hypothetical protein
MKAYLFFFLLLVAQVAWAQDSTAFAADSTWRPYHAYAPKHSILIGTGTSGQIVKVRASLTGPVETNQLLQFDPRIAFFATERLALGLDMTFGKNWGTLVPDFSYYGYGAFGRYYFFTRRRAPLINHERIPFFRKGQLWKRADNSQRRLFAEHLFPYLELGGGFSNLRLQTGLAQVLDRPTEPRVYLVLGMDIRLWKCIFFEAGFAKAFYPNSKDIPSSPLGTRAGFEIILPTHKIRP